VRLHSVQNGHVDGGVTSDGFAFAGGGFADPPLVENLGRHQLDVEVAVVACPPAGFANESKRLGLDVVAAEFALGAELSQLQTAGAELLVAPGPHRRLERVDLFEDELHSIFHDALVAAATEQFQKQFSDHWNHAHRI
jgi:hypothetical protein